MKTLCQLLSLVALLCVAAPLQGAEPPFDKERTALLALPVPVLRALAEKGNAVAQYVMGDRYDIGLDVEKDEEEAVKWYRKAAEQGIAEAQLNLGVCYANGRGVVKDRVEAYKWYLLAGAKGDKDAEKNIKVMERNLTVTDRSEGQKRATEWKAEFDAKANGKD